MEKYLENGGNPTLFSFGLENVVKVLHSFCLSNPGIPLVSIGSGFGLIERLVRDQISELEVFAIDPDPQKYCDYGDDYDRCVEEFGMRPTHSTIEDFLKFTQPVECIMLLNWCDTGKENPYDLEAVEKLQPKEMLIIMEKYGASHSLQFHRFLRDQTIYKTVSEYNIIDNYTSFIPCSHITHQIKWLSLVERNDLPLTKLNFVVNGDILPLLL